MTGTIDLILRAFDVILDWRKLVYTLVMSMFIVLVFGAFTVPGVLFAAATAESPVVSGTIATVSIGLAYLLGAVLGGAAQGGLTYMAVASLTGAPRVGVRAAIGRAFRRVLGFGLAPFVPLLLSAAVVLTEIVVLLPGRIPAVGALWSALLFYPLLLVNVFVALGLVIGGWLLYPAMVVGEKSLPAAVREVMALLRTSPMRITAIGTLGILAMVFAFVLIALMLSIAAIMTTVAATVGAGELPGGFALTDLQAAGGSGMVGGLQNLGRGLGNTLFIVISLVVYVLLLTIPTTLWNALGAAVYLSVGGAATPTQPTPVATPTPFVAGSASPSAP